jgi:hypothetical protein
MRSVIWLMVSVAWRAGPQRLDDHGLDGEGRVLLAAQLS